jgi:heme A synthase
MFGRWLPPLGQLDQAPVLVHLAHRAGALVVFAVVLRLAARAHRAQDSRFIVPARLAVVLVLFQIGLGAATVLTGKAVTPTTAHVATGAAILGLCWLTTLRARRHLRAATPAPAVGTVLGDPALS